MPVIKICGSGTEDLLLRKELGQHRHEHLGRHDVFLALQNPVPSVRQGVGDLLLTSIIHAGLAPPTSSAGTVPPHLMSPMISFLHRHRVNPVPRTKIIPSASTRTRATLAILAPEAVRIQRKIEDVLADHEHGS